MTLKELLSIYNFREFEEVSRNNKDCYDSQIVRIWIDNSLWFLLGVNDFYEGGGVEVLEKVIKPEIINSKIGYIFNNTGLGYLEIYLTKEEEDD